MQSNHKKVVCVHLLNDYSGSPKVLSQSIAALIESGVFVDVITNRNTHGFLSGLNVGYKLFNYKNSTNKFVTLFRFLIAQVFIFFKVLCYAKQDITFYVNTLLPFGAALAAKLIGKPVIYHIHETSLRPYALKVFLKFVVKITATRIIYVSQALAYKEPILSVPAVVIHNALSTEFITRAKGAVYQPVNQQGCFIVLMICSLKRYKGVDQFIKLAEMSLVNKKLQYQLVLNAEDAEIDSYFGGMDLPANLKVYRRQTDLDAFYRGASVVLNLSLPDQCEETFGLTLIEAMAYHVPVIAPPVGGPTEIVVNNENGYLISAYELDALYSAVSRLAADSELCVTLSQRVASTVNKFNIIVYNQNILNILNLAVCNNEISNNE